MIEEAKHIGRNLRNIRLLKGMKQTTFAQELGIAQQNVSKMENKEKLSMKKLEAAAKALGITVEAIEKFNEKVYLNNNIALEQNAGQIVHPVKEIIEYFKGELLKKDNRIEELSSELEKYRNEKRKSAEPKESKKRTELKTVPMPQDKKAAK
ncbi:MAG TPA: helix-turn-helix transcriptional regulator [Hanamia sp.]